MGMKPCCRKPYHEISATSYFSFLRGASAPEEFIHTAHKLAYKSIAITDRNSLAGIVRAHGALKDLKDKIETKLTLLIGAAIEILPENHALQDNKEETQRLPCGSQVATYYPPNKRTVLRRAL